MNRLEKAIKLAEGLSYEKPTKEHVKSVLDSMTQFLKGGDWSAKFNPVWKRYLYYPKGTSNKFHLFAIFKGSYRGDTGGKIVGANGSGRVDGAVKTTVISVGKTFDEVQKDVDAKYMKKVKKGYVDVTDELK